MRKPLQFAAGNWVAYCTVDTLPDLYDLYAENAVLRDEIDLGSPDGSSFFIAAGRAGDDWPALVVAQTFAPGTSSGFSPGVLVAQDTGVLFLGAGTRLLAYDLATPRRLWEDDAGVGFWSWRQFGSIVVMAAEADLAAFRTTGEKLWATSVEPPWSYNVDGEDVLLDIMGNHQRFPLADGPPKPKRPA